MSAEDVIQSVSDEFKLGWSVGSQFALLCEYVDNQGDESALEDFMRRKAEEEKDEGEDAEHPDRSGP